MSQAGESNGLELILDAHSDLVSASSIPNDFQVRNRKHYAVLMKDINTQIYPLRDLKL